MTCLLEVVHTFVGKDFLEEEGLEGHKVLLKRRIGGGILTVTGKFHSFLHIYLLHIFMIKTTRIWLK